MGLYFCTVRPMFIIASVRLYVCISCCKDSLRSAEGHSMHFLYYSYCANEQPPGGTWKIPQSFFFHIHLIKWTVHEESFYSHVAFQHWCLVFSPRGEVEKEDCCILVSFDSLNSVCVCVCVCADTARGNPTRPCTPALLEFTQEGQTVQNER